MAAFIAKRVEVGFVLGEGGLHRVEHFNLGRVGDAVFFVGALASEL